MASESQRRDPFQRETTEDQVQRVIDAGERARQDAAHNVERTADRTEQAAHGALHRAGEKVRETARDMQSRDVGDMAHDARMKAEQAGRQAADQIDSAMTATGERMSDAAHALRERAPAGRTGEVATRTADALEKSGEYLRRADVDVVRTDLERLIRNHPIEALFVGLGVGFLLARMTRR